MKYDITKLTLEEKLTLLTGKDTWQLETAGGKLPSVFLSDGPNGLRMHDVNTPNHETKMATAMPSLSLVTSTWDPELAHLDGRTIADDCIEKGADVLLAPGVNIKRTPLCGRNFEYPSEDPYIAGVMAKAYIEGVQSKGVGTSLKHFCANNREYDRFAQNSEIDERTLREIYLRPFEIAAEAKPWTVMCSYNPVNGVYASENKWLLNDVLREEFGFDGLIVSDWSAVRQSARSAKATLDLEMPHRAEAYSELKAAYDSGWLTEAELDERVTKIVELMEKVAEAEKRVETTKEERHAVAAKIAGEGMVLLKNEEGILPLRGGKLLVAGPYADGNAMGGGGSAFVRTDYKVRPLGEELSARLGERAEMLTCVARVTAGLRHTYMQRIVRTAYNADTVVLCVGTGEQIESEGYDRATIRLLPVQEDLILSVARVNPNVVVVLEAASAVDMSPWIDKVKAVLLAGFSGEGGQEAIADILVGNICPSGKLVETYPFDICDTPTGEEHGDGFTERYAEGIMVGYRWYDKCNCEVLFPFGHGLSYAEFAYSDLEITKTGDASCDVTFTVTNTSNIPAKEVAQVYVRDVFASVERPEKELKGFTKIALGAGESKRVTVSLDSSALAFWSVPLKKWYVENGTFEIMVGASSRDIRLAGKLEVTLPECEQYTQL